MKKMIFLCAFCFAMASSFAQKETFDLITYTPPKAWKKQPAEGAIRFSKEDAAKGTYCMITVFKSVASPGNPKENFDMAWASLVKEMVTVSTDPEMQPAATENGWEIQSGYAPFENDDNKGVVILVTSSGFEKMMNIMILTNTDVYEKNVTAFLESIDLKKPKTPSPPVIDNNTNNVSIIGTWGKGNSVSHAGGSFGRWSYTKEQYIFDKKGTYSFARKVYVEDDKETLLTRETGTYTISGNKIIISPNTNKIEAWSKTNGGDNFKQLISSQKKPLEKTTYQFTKQYDTELKDTFFILIADKKTARDGLINANTISPIAWRYGPTPPFTPIKMPN